MRLFVALDISEESRAALARRAAEVRAELPAARWVDLAGAHLTLVFLGEIAEPQLPAIAGALDRAAAAHAPLTLQVAGGGSFPPRQPARVAWAAVREVEPTDRDDAGMRSRDDLPGDRQGGDGREPAPAGRLAALQGDVAKALHDAIGFQPEDRPYHPHVTVARCDPPWPRAAAERFAVALAVPLAPAFTVGEVLLMRSIPGRGGVRYVRLGAHPLGAAP